MGVLGASNFTYVEGCESRELPEWIGAHVRMLQYFGGVPAAIVPDNLKAGVRHACYYDPDLNPSLHELALHYGTTILPTRVRRPRDKAKAEVGVQVVERWILARLRKHTFFQPRRDECGDPPTPRRPGHPSLPEVGGSRRSLFESLDRPALRPLPATPYECAPWKKARVNIDYHIDVLGHYYSVPHTLVRVQWTCGSRARPCRSSMTAVVSPLTCAVTRRAASQQTRRTDPSRTRSTWSGRLRV